MAKFCMNCSSKVSDDATVCPSCSAEIMAPSSTDKKAHTSNAKIFFILAAVITVLCLAVVLTISVL